MTLLDNSGRPISKLQGPMFWFQMLPDGSPDLSCLNVTVIYADKTYLGQIKLVEVVFDRKITS